jgi:hypothetical protein
MTNRWPTKNKDIETAQQIMEDYATRNNLDSLGLFELVVDQEEKKMDFRLSPWVGLIASHFSKEYGEEKGDRVTRSIISNCITKEHTVH